MKTLAKLIHPILGLGTAVALFATAMGISAVAAQEQQQQQQDQQQQQQQDQQDLKLDYALNGTLTATSDTGITVQVANAGNSAKAKIGTSLNIQVTQATVMTQNGKRVYSSKELMTGSRVNVNGYMQGNNVYANRIEAHTMQFVLTGTINSINKDTGELTVKVKAASKPLKSYLGKILTVKITDQTTIRLNKYFSTLAELTIGQKVQIKGNIQNSTAVADRILVIAR